MRTVFSGAMVGPMPADLFLGAYVDPEVLPRRRRIPKYTFSRISTRSTCHDIEAELVNAVNSQKWCPNFTLEKHSETVDCQSGGQRGPTLSLHSPSAPKEPLTWSNLELRIHIRANENSDPFRQALGVQSGRKLRSNDEDACRKVLEDLDYHITSQFSRQHRTSILLLCIFGRYVRFIRVDRSGMVVSTALNYVEDPRLLAEFFWCYSHLPPVERGFDSTVVPASVEEGELLTRAIAQYMQAVKDNTARFHPSMAPTLSSDYPIYKVKAFNRHAKKDSYYIIRRPCSESKKILGRATRGYIALALDDDKHCGSSPAKSPELYKQLVFMKDYWRRYPSDICRESDVYHALEEVGVPHLPILWCGDDVKNDNNYIQRTQTRNLLNLRGVKWARSSKPIARYAHHRLVQELAFPLETVANAKELVQVVRDSLQGLIAAWIKNKRLHRDISYNNILLLPPSVPEGSARGVLNDWDISLQISHDTSPAKIPRGGTYRYMSIDLLDGDKSHEIQDDLEFLHQMFDEKITVFHNGRYRVSGGHVKHYFLYFSRVRFLCPALDELIKDMRDFWREYHHPLDTTCTKSQSHDRLLADPSVLLSFFDKALQKGPDAWVDDLSLPDRYLSHWRHPPVDTGEYISSESESPVAPLAQIHPPAIPGPSLHCSTKRSRSQVEQETLDHDVATRKKSKI